MAIKTHKPAWLKERAKFGHRRPAWLREKARLPAVIVERRLARAEAIVMAFVIAGAGLAGIAAARGVTRPLISYIESLNKTPDFPVPRPGK